MTTKIHETDIDVDAQVPLVRITRDFDAPPEKVFRAHTDPDLLTQWNGPRSLQMRIDHYDCRTGGSYRYLHIRGSDEFGFHGSFHEVRPSELIVQTFTFEGDPDGVALEPVRPSRFAWPFPIAAALQGKREPQREITQNIRGGSDVPEEQKRSDQRWRAAGSRSAQASGRARQAACQDHRRSGEARDPADPRLGGTSGRALRAGPARHRRTESVGHAVIGRQAHRSVAAAIPALEEACRLRHADGGGRRSCGLLPHPEKAV
jgi:uncharacterized protein YndB with AHSA1/START domain